MESCFSVRGRTDGGVVWGFFGMGIDERMVVGKLIYGTRADGGWKANVRHAGGWARGWMVGSMGVFQYEDYMDGRWMVNIFISASPFYFSVEA